MDSEILNKWLENVHGLRYLPGTFCDFVESPFLPDKIACTVGITLQHRFAFYFWANFMKDFNKKLRSKYPKSPVLVSLDYHNDFGVESDFDKKEIQNLNFDNRTELGLFCWLRLNPLNDGHIYPAVFLNFFSNVYILLKQKLCNQNERIVNDKDGKPHLVKYFYSENDLIEEINKSNEYPVYLDIDLDYFIKKNYSQILGDGVLIKDKKIRKILSLDKALMASIFHRIVGLTIALEPEHCGGITNSLHVLGILDNEFFKKTLSTSKCIWKK